MQFTLVLVNLLCEIRRFYEMYIQQHTWELSNIAFITAYEEFQTGNKIYYADFMRNYFKYQFGVVNLREVLLFTPL